MRYASLTHPTGFSTFLEILQTIATNKGKLVHFVERFYPSSKTCSGCGFVFQELSLKEREWDCPNCNTRLERDRNAAINIQRVGTSTLKLDTIRLPIAANVV